jgi:hypothetical protein
MTDEQQTDPDGGHDDDGDTGDRQCTVNGRR